MIPKQCIDLVRSFEGYHTRLEDGRYPGISCVNWALYEGAATYGATLHLMSPEVDAGPIVDVATFPVAAGDTVATLLAKTYDAMLALALRYAPEIAAGTLRAGNVQWTGAHRSRADLDRLAMIHPAMDGAEIARRVRATTCPPWYPRIEFGGQVFELIQERCNGGS